ncbi:TauD/TfdA family dioxygenase [Streptomyces cinnabarinus]|uniref:TauD/TfdA family dioxygenase n=1 Tax=Streptomyces cinnabarinus TaxID=67287 RepID=A0ABY7KFZ2_9ACTN|nr:TauD/TfdA family dioxygenase [Streptomyces cinnabarinus]WAZ21814.1 TauD/TfdA family dioxygenase [Streptomyces cinnabarinus]
MTDEDPFAHVRFAVEPGLADSIAAADQDGVPDPRHTEFAERLRGYAADRLDRRPGCFVLTGLGGLSDAAARRFTVNASRMLGEVMPQDFSGALLREVKDRGLRLDGASARYSDTRQGGNLHTDGFHRPGRVPDYFTLFCLRQAALGGSLVMVHVQDVLTELRARPDVLDVLRRPFHFDTRADTPGAPRTVRRPVLDFADGSARVHYLREYVEAGHRQDGVAPLTPEQTGALDHLDGLLARADLHTLGRLRPGEMVFIDNRSVIHGRTPFEDGSAGRMMFRTWIAA